MIPVHPPHSISGGGAWPALFVGGPWHGQWQAMSKWPTYYEVETPGRLSAIDDPDPYMALAIERTVYVRRKFILFGVTHRAYVAQGLIDEIDAALFRALCGRSLDAKPQAHDALRYTLPKPDEWSSRAGPAAARRPVHLEGCPRCSGGDEERGTQAAGRDRWSGDGSSAPGSSGPRQDGRFGRSVIPL